MELNTLPRSGVLFLGGHQNMTKKLQQKYPGWQFMSDDQLRKGIRSNVEIVFYWTAHGSHKMMKFVYSRLPKNTAIHYVTATNLSRLEREMQDGFRAIHSRCVVGV